MGVAALDLGAPALFLSQSAESAGYVNTLTLLQTHTPDIVVTCSTAGASRLTALLAKLYGSSARLVALPRSSFDDTRGRSTVRLVATEKDALARDSKALYLAFAAADACVRFCADELQLLVRLRALSVSEARTHAARAGDSRLADGPPRDFRPPRVHRRRHGA